MATAPIRRILVAQLLITLLGLAGIFYDREVGLSMAAGAGLCLLSNALASPLLFRRKRASGIREERGRMRRAWALRWSCALVGFGLIFGLYREVQALTFLAAYAAAQAAHLIGHLSFDGD